jgi:hypothetical protein
LWQKSGRDGNRSLAAPFDGHEVGMSQTLILLIDAAAATPLVLCGILIWTGVERRVELAARERTVRAWMMRPRVAPSAPLVLVAPDRSAA